MKKITLLAGFGAVVFSLFRPTAVAATNRTGSKPKIPKATAGGEIVWSVDLAYTPETAAPRVAPSGTIYIHSDDLYAISSTGRIIWRKNSADPKAVDVGPDGTVYSGSGGTIFAYTPAGQLLWSFTEPPGGQGLIAGPTVERTVMLRGDRRWRAGCIVADSWRPVDLESTWLRELSGNGFDAGAAHPHPALFRRGCRAGLHRIQ